VSLIINFVFFVCFGVVVVVVSRYFIIEQLHLFYIKSCLVRLPAIFSILFLMFIHTNSQKYVIYPIISGKRSVHTQGENITARVFFESGRYVHVLFTTRLSLKVNLI